MNKTVLWIGLLVLLAIYKRKTIMSLTTSTAAALQNQNVQAFLAMIRQFESGGDYNILYGPPRSDPLYDPNAPTHFTDMSAFPDIRINFTNPATGNPDFSTAAGAYQINHPTYLVWSVLPGTPGDFSPATQDYLAVNGLKIIGALNDIIAGNFQTAVETASGTWASLPGSTAMQNPKSLQVAQNAYQNYGGTIA
jgi:muramidase (phage lysozyme)